MLAAGGAVDGLVAGVEVEAAVGPVEELAGLFFADEFFANKGLDEAVAEEFGEGLKALDGQQVEAAQAVVEAGGGEDVEVGVEDEVVAEGLHGGDGGELSIGEVEAGAEPVAQARDGGGRLRIGRGSRSKRDGRSARGAKPADGGDGRWKAQRAFIRTSSCGRKIVCETSDEEVISTSRNSQATDR